MTPVSLGLYLPSYSGRTSQTIDERSSLMLMIHTAVAHESTSSSKLCQ